MSGLPDRLWVARLAHVSMAFTARPERSTAWPDLAEIEYIRADAVRLMIEEAASQVAWNLAAEDDDTPEGVAETIAAGVAAGLANGSWYRNLDWAARAKDRAEQTAKRDALAASPQGTP